MYPKLKPLSVDFVDEREAAFISKWGVLETSLRSAFEFCIISATCASGCSVSNYRDVSSLWHSLLLTSQVTSGPFHFWPSDRSLDELSYQTLELFKPSSLWNGRPPLCHKRTPGGSSTKSGSGSTVNIVSHHFHLNGQLGLWLLKGYWLKKSLSNEKMRKTPIQSSQCSNLQKTTALVTLNLWNCLDQ